MRVQHILKASAMIIASLAALPLAAQTTSTGSGQAYPARTVRVVVAFPPGAGVDIAIRLVTPKLSEAFGQPFVIDNRPGAGGNVGAEIAAHATADGYTLFGGGAPAAISQTLYPKLGYDLLKDFDAIALVATVPLVLVVHPSLPVTSARNLAALARAKPGELTYASTGSGSTPHLTAEMLKMHAGMQIVHVPYKGTPAAVTDVVAGRVTFMFANSLSVLPQVQSGRLRALAISSAKRSALTPNLPTLAETYPGFESGTWYAFAAPAGTPRDIITRLNGAIVKALQMPDVREKLQAQGAEILSGTPEEAGSFIRSEVTKWGKVVKASGARAD
jgi:tripartite-type tricarboxylate transporter receptor subunit TctC